MPQININEIDQSIYNRVTNNNLLKVFVPGIATFGPVYDGTEYSLQSFTNKQDFQKVYGYNLPEQNPIKNDYSKLYAEQLLDNGAEVSFVRLNEGITATFDIGVTDKDNDTIDNRNIPTAVRKGKSSDIISNEYKFCTQIEGIEAKYSGSFGNKLLITIQPVNSVNRAFTYQYANITVYKADFIEETKKYSTNNTYVTSSVIKSVTKLESNIVSTNPFDTSYFEDVEFNFIKIKATSTARSEFTIIWSSLNGSYTTTDTILSGFPTIDLKYTNSTGKTVYNEAALIGSPAEPWNKPIYTVVTFTGSGTAQDPYVPAYEADKYYTKSGTEEAPVYTLITTENAPANWGTADTFYTFANPIASLPTSKGWDFKFSTALQNVLATGFKGMTMEDDKYTYANVNRYNFECYAPATQVVESGATNTYGGIIYDIYDNLVNCFPNFTDPYIYEFDFVTTGTLIDNEFTITWKQGAETKTLSVTTTEEERATDYATLTTTGASELQYFSTVTDANGDFADNVAGASTVPVPTILKRVHTAMLELVTGRQDCIALIDPCVNWNPSNLTNYTQQINSSFATMHSPYCYVNSPVAYELILMPPSYIFLMTELNTLISSGTEVQKWYPPAGVTRATARMVVKPYYEIGSVLLNAWQNDSLSRVNPIMKLKSYGYVIYGNYTCRVADDVNSFSALDSLNVRITANCVKQQIFNVCMSLTFEPNNSSLWMKFYDAMDKYLLFMKRNNGLYDYKIQMDESTVTTDDINQLRCPGKVWINPTRTAEFFDIDFTITEAGVTFSNVVGEGE